MQPSDSAVVTTRKAVKIIQQGARAGMESPRRKCVFISSIVGHGARDWAGQQARAGRDLMGDEEREKKRSRKTVFYVEYSELFVR
jgi:hypothetical protein